MKIDHVLNRDILVTGYKLRTSKFNDNGSGRCLALQFALNEERYILFTASSILIEQVEKYRQEIPFLATIKKIDRYYTLS
jgi:hypothetical protein